MVGQTTYVVCVSVLICVPACLSGVPLLPPIAVGEERVSLGESMCLSYISRIPQRYNNHNGTITP